MTTLRRTTPRKTASPTGSPVEDTTRSFAGVYARMLAALPLVELPALQPGGEPVRPLAGLNLDARADFSLALVTCWAMIADSLAFYNERIAAEGYLRTALEDRSLLYLSRMLGYTRWPGAAAETWLALTVAATAIPQDKARTGIVRVPAGGNLVVQNIPAQGALPVVFECQDEVEARAEWNTLRLHLPSAWVPAVAFDGMRGVRLAGAVTSLRAGSPLLVCTASENFFRLLESVEVDRTAGYTVVTWAEPLRMQTEQAIEAVSTFRQSAGLFGRRAGAWSQSGTPPPGTPAGGVLTLERTGVEAWRSIQGALPAAATVRALACTPGGTLLAATALGLYRLAASGPDAATPAWTALPLTPAQQDVQSLLADGRGVLYAGGARGTISFSPDGGETWQPLRLPVALPTSHDGSRLLHALFPHATAAETPTTPLDGVVRAIATLSVANAVLTFVGTDRGIFGLAEGGLTWLPLCTGLPGTNPATGLSTTGVHALFADPAGTALYAGTTQGLFHTAVGGKEGAPAVQWTLQPMPWVSPPGTLQPTVLCFAETRGALFAGTSVGLFAAQRGVGWVSAGRAVAGCTVHALAAGTQSGAAQGQTATLLAATSRGVFRLDAGGWTQLGRQSLAAFRTVDDGFAQGLDAGQVVPALRDLFAANGWTLPDGVAVTTLAAGTLWEIGDAPDNRTATGGDAFLAALAQGVLSVSRLMALSAMEIQAVALAPDGRTVIACAAGALLEPEWPDFQLEGGAFALDRVVTGIAAGSRAVLTQTPPQPHSLALELAQAEQRPVTAWGRQATVSVLTPAAPDARLGLLRQRDTMVYLRETPLLPFVAELPYAGPIAGDSLTLAGGLGSLASGMNVALTGLRPSALLLDTGGLLSGPAGEGGTLAAAGLEHENVTALLAAGGYAWAAVEGAGIYRRPAAGSAWQPLAEEDGPPDVTCMAWADGMLVAGTAAEGGRMWTAKHGYRTLADAPPGMLALAATDTGTFYAGTAEHGIWQWHPATPRWTRVVKLPGVAALLAAPGVIYAGAEHGVYRRGGDGGWTPLVGLDAAATEPDTGETAPTLENATPPGPRGVMALVQDARTLYAGTAAGEVYAWPLVDAGQPPDAGQLAQAGQALGWTLCTPESLPAPVTALTLPGGMPVAATAGAGLWRSPRAGLWEPLPIAASNVIHALATVEEPGGQTPALLAACSTTTMLHSAELGLVPAMRQLLFTAPAGCAGTLDLEAMPATLTTLFKEAGMTLRAPAVTVRRRGRLWLVRDGGAAWLLYRRDRGLPGECLCVTQAALLTAHARSQATQSVLRWTLSLDGIATGTLDLPEGALVTGAGVAGSTVSEVRILAAANVSLAGDTTACTLTRPLGALFDPASTTLTANLAYATQGATVAVEVLGSGNAAVAGQGFRLHQPPLTWTHDRASAGLTSSLEVRVTASAAAAPQAARLQPAWLQPGGAQATTSALPGEPWMQVPTLFGTAPADQVYSLSTDAAGAVTVCFGDGREGARVPTGAGNVLARYRTGLGPAGNVPAGSLIVFRKRPLGLRAVTNPLPGTRGTPPEPLATTRDRMNRNALALDRIVSFDDYTGFCLARANVEKVRVERLNTADGILICITAALVGGLSITDEPAEKDALERAIDAARASRDPFTVRGFRTLRFRIAARLGVAATEEPDAVRAAAVRALETAFSRTSRAFAQSVTAEEVHAVLASVASVRDVDLRLLYRTGTLPSPASVLPAQGARWDAARARLLPAELLLFDPTDDAQIAVHEVP